MVVDSTKKRKQNQSKHKDVRTVEQISEEVYAPKSVYPVLNDSDGDRVGDVTHADFLLNPEKARSSQVGEWVSSESAFGGFEEDRQPKVHDGDRKAVGLPLRDCKEDLCIGFGELAMRDVSGRLAYDFSRFVCAGCDSMWRNCADCRKQKALEPADREDSNARHCKAHPPTHQHCLLEGHDIAVVEQVYAAAKEKGAYEKKSDAAQEEMGRAAVKELAEKLVGKHKDAFSYRVTCRSKVCQIERGTMSIKDFGSFQNGKHKDANNEFGNEQHHCKKLLVECLTLIRELWEDEFIDEQEARALLEDTRKHTVWTDYKELLFVGTAHAIAKGAIRTGFPLTVATQQSFVDNMQRLPQRYFDRVLVPHCLDDTFPPKNIHKQRNPKGPNGEERSWFRETDALLKLKYPDALSCCLLFAVHKNWQLNGEPTKEPRHFVQSESPSKALFMGSRSFFEMVKFDLTEATLEKRRVTTFKEHFDSSKTAVRSHIPSTFDTDGQKKWKNLEWSLPFGQKDGAGVPPACNSICRKNNVEVKPRYSAAAKCWGEDGLPLDILELFLERCKPHSKGFEVSQAAVIHKPHDEQGHRVKKLRLDILNHRCALTEMPLGRARMVRTSVSVIRGAPSLIGMQLPRIDPNAMGSVKLLTYKAAVVMAATLRMHVSAKRVVKLISCMSSGGLHLPMDECTVNAPKETLVLGAHAQWNELLCNDAVVKAMAETPSDWTDSIVNQLTDDRCTKLAKAAKDMLWAFSLKHETFSNGICREYSFELVRHLEDFGHAVQALTASLPDALARSVTRTTPRYIEGHVDNTEAQAATKANYNRLEKEGVLDPTAFSLKEYATVDRNHVHKMFEVRRNRAKKRWFENSFQHCQGDCACQRFVGWSFAVPDDPCGASCSGQQPLAEWKTACSAAKQASLPRPPRPKHLKTFGVYLEEREINEHKQWPSYDEMRAKFALEHLLGYSRLIHKRRREAEEPKINNEDKLAIGWQHFNDESKKFDTETLPKVRGWLLQTRTSEYLDGKFKTWSVEPPKQEGSLDESVVDWDEKLKVDVVTAIWAPMPEKLNVKMPRIVNKATNEPLAKKMMGMRDEHYQHQVNLREESEAWMLSSSLLEIFKHERAAGAWTNFRLSAEFQNGLTKVENHALPDKDESEKPRKKKCKKETRNTSLKDLMQQQ